MTSTVTVDGGATGGRARLHVDGRALSTVSGPPLSVTTVGVDVVSKRILDLLAALPLPSEETLASVSVGLAGGVASDRTQRIAAAVGERYPRARVAVGRDIDLVLAHLAGPGVALIVGTGAIAVALGREGELMVDGRGFAIGDRGSGAWIGLEAVRRELSAIDHGGRESRLFVALRHELGLASDRGFARELFGGGGGPDAARVAALAPIVLDLAGEGDAAATAVIADAVAELARSVASARVRAGVQAGAPVVVAGGLTRALVFSERLRLALQDHPDVGPVSIVDPLDASL